MSAKEMSEDGPPRCASCPFYLPKPTAPPTTPERGECHEGSPHGSAVVTGQTLVQPSQQLARPGVQRPPEIRNEHDIVGYWPPTNMHGWCGKHPDFAEWLAANREVLAMQKRLAAQPQEGEA